MLDLFVEVVASAPEFAEAWRVLMARVSGNVFMDPGAVGAAETTAVAKPQTLAVWDRSAAPPVLLGVWAMQAIRPLPILGRVLSTPPSPHAFVSDPVIDPANRDAVATAFFDRIAKDPALPKVVRMRHLDGDDATLGTIRRALASLNAHVAVLSRRQRAYAWRDHGIKKSGSTRKKLRQDWNRLAGQGALAYANRRDAASVVADFEAFLALEAASWKGSNQTAILSSGEDARFARQMIANLTATNRASVAMLTLDGTPIATQVVLYSGNVAYTWKTAFDARQARHSPGALLVDKVAEELFAGSEIDAIESCSPQGGFMETLWSGRRETVDLLADLSPRKSLTFRAVGASIRAKRRLKDWRDALRARRAARNRA